MKKLNKLLSVDETSYYAVIFTSVLNERIEDYQETNAVLVALAEKIPGYLGEESVRTSIGIAVSYWKDLASIDIWRKNVDHIMAKKRGQTEWYQAYTIRIAEVQWSHEFTASAE